MLTYEIEAVPGHPRAGAVSWIAETYSPSGVTADGLVVEPVAGEPLQVRVTVPAGSVGDTVIFASYPVASGGVVLARPQLVHRAVPGGASVVGIVLSPGDEEVAIGDPLELGVFVEYDDSSRLMRWIEMDDVLVTSSDPAVVDVSDELNWEAVGAGVATVSVTHSGFTEQSVITVYDPYARPILAPAGAVG